MRLLRVVRSHLLDCGCFVGVYETYSGRNIEIIDDRGHACGEASHRPGAVLRAPSTRPDRPEPGPHHASL
ncbi:MAG: hypothetical protein IMZ55_13600 [Acidobacteria bacterium]|nr:hypothetical protein [Acidobacteriota bacterium]